MPKADRLSPGAVQFLKERQIANFVTLGSNGRPQVTPVWVDVEEDGSHILINTSDGRIKDRNVARDPRVAICVVDPQNFQRTIQVQGRVVERRKEGAIDHINQLSHKYNGRDYTFREPGDAERRVIFRIKPDYVIERNTAPR
jgi:PPOX class probable F420-dependent enzyme